LIQINNNDEHLIGVDGDADEPLSGDVGRGLGATTETMVLTRTRTNDKSRFGLCLVKESY
jgi:hypothetical protein